MANISVNDWLESLAAKQPTPGGGAAAGLGLATAAALVSMVSVYTTGEKWADRTERMEAINEQAMKLRGQALELMDEDAQAFAAVGAAYRMPVDNDADKDTRNLAIQTALAGAAEPPRQIVTLSADVIDLCQELVTTANPNVISDVAVAASFSKAAVEAAIVNVEINEKLLSDESEKVKLQESVKTAETLLTAADAVVKEVRQRMQAS